MKIFDQNYVGINHDRKDVTVAPLAFLTPYEDNAAGKKRQESVNTWVSGSYYWVGDKAEKDETPKDIRIVPNIPRSGFKVVDVAGRWMTANKFARIYDPAGYELEISIDNLVDLMLYSVVDHGVIQEELIWARDGAHNRLIPVSSDLYKNALREGQSINPVVGDIVEGQHGRQYVYLGTGYAQLIGLKGVETRVRSGDQTDHWPFSFRNYHDRYDLAPEAIATVTAKGPAQYIYYYLPKGKYDGEPCIQTRKKPMKAYAIVGKSDIRLDPNEVYRSGDGSMYNADGKFVVEDDAVRDDSYHYYTRACMVRDAPFTSKDIDFASTLPKFQELE